MAQLTLPAEIRHALGVKEGDFLAAKVVKNGVLLQPVAVVERHRAWQRAMQAASKVKDRRPDPRQGAKAEEDWIAGEVKRYRRQRKNG
ncbi:MAG: hypothetical protein WBF58_17600 [Xanthobacteraceae bacterium]